MSCSVAPQLRALLDTRRPLDTVLDLLFPDATQTYPTGSLIDLDHPTFPSFSTSGSRRLFQCDPASLPLFDHCINAIIAIEPHIYLGQSKLLPILEEFRRVSKPNCTALLRIPLSTALPLESDTRHTHSAIHPHSSSERADGFGVPAAFAEVGYHIIELRKEAINGSQYLWILARLPMSAFSTELRFAEYGTSWRQTLISDAASIAAKSARFAGISRIARIDRLGGFDAPVYTATRPLSRIAVTSATGKGTCDQESRLSAIFEAIEIASAERPVPSILAAARELDSQAESRLPLLDVATAGDLAASINWSQVCDFDTGETTWCPTVAVGMLVVPGPFIPSSNGLASDCTFYGAVLHGVLEVLERHAYSLALVQQDACSVDLESVADPYVGKIRAQCAALGLTLDVRDLSRYVGVPACYCLICDLAEEDSELLGGGLGCHPDSVLALRRAVAEAVQSRVTVIAGAREDITETKRFKGRDFAALREVFGYWYSPTLRKVELPHSLSGINDLPAQRLISHILATARTRDPAIGRLWYHVFPTPADVWVVRSIIEGAELFALDRTRLGRTLAPFFERLALS
jgi:ribosomal protein S12 methylthiotransferase accessory factor